MFFAQCFLLKSLQKGCPYVKIRTVGNDKKITIVAKRDNRKISMKVEEKKMAKKVVLAGACRTAIGTMGGSLSTTPAPELGAIVIKEA